MVKNIRYPAVTGSFYPSNKKELEYIVDTFLQKAKKIKIEGKIKALIVPHAGYIYSGSVAAVGYKLLRDKDITKVILIGPSHRIFIKEPAGADYNIWQTPLGRVRVIDPLFDFKINNSAHKLEHSLEVQLPFLQKVLSDFSIIPIVVNQDKSRELAQKLAPIIDKKTFIVISSDLSHYYPYDQAVTLDSYANKLIPAVNIKGVEKKVEACGKEAIVTLLHLCKIKNWQGRLLEYKNSGDTAGDKLQVVGYGCYGFLKK